MMKQRKDSGGVLCTDGPEVLKAEYYKQKTQFYSSFPLVPPPPTSKSKKVWDSVYEKQLQSGVTSKEFIQAQFSYFEQTFKTTPSLKHLLTKGAVQRAQDFAKSGGKFTPGKAYVSVGSDEAELLRSTDEQLRDMCKAQGITRVEFYKKFVLTGFFPVTPKYTELDPEYHKAKTEWDDAKTRL
jgi:hypothetical protein